MKRANPVGALKQVAKYPVALGVAIASISGFVTPAMRSVMTSQIPANAQGELQGALSSLSSITAILGPLLMTQLFAWYSAPDAAFYFPGMSFLAAAALSALSLLVFVFTVKGLGTAQPEAA